MTDAITNTTGIIAEKVGELAKMAGMVLQHMWVIFTRQQMLLGLQTFVKGVFFLVVSYFSYRLAKFLFGNKQLLNLDRYFVTLIAAIATAVFLFKGADLVVLSLPRLLNPEYYALQDAVRMLQEAQSSLK